MNVHSLLICSYRYVITRSFAASALPAALLAVALTGGVRAASPAVDAGRPKPRIVVMTDIGGDPDDRQSMVRFLLYACDFDVEGLCTGFGHGHDHTTRPELIREAVDAYGQVLPNLRKHRPDYPTRERLAGLIKDGHNGDPHKVGPGMDSEASNDFEARMDWCTKPFDQANHAPTAVCNHDQTRRVLTAIADPKAEVPLSAAGSSDPDGDKLSYRWWVYREAGTYWDAVPIEEATAAEAVLRVPEDASGRTIHVILEVVDNGRPPLTAYRRVVVNVTGKRVAPPPGTVDAEEDLTEPVMKLDGPSAETGPWRFWRGINVNGSPIEIDGNRWEGDDAASFVCRDKALTSPHVQLRPPTDAARAKMIHSFRWDREPKLEFTDVPKGSYAVYAYVWEETAPETLTIRLNGRVVQQNYHSGSAGRWRRLGPWTCSIDSGRITITSSGGAANFSGIEVWQRVGGERR